MLSTLKLLLPALIPSWTFFDVITASPRIEYAHASTSTAKADGWREFRPRPDSLALPATLMRLFWNARWNEALFVVSCAERLLAEPTAHSEDEIFHRIAADLADRGMAAEGWLTFRILLVSEKDGAIIRDLAFISNPRRLAAIPVQ